MDDDAWVAKINVKFKIGFSETRIDYLGKWMKRIIGWKKKIFESKKFSFYTFSFIIYILINASLFFCSIKREKILNENIKDK